MISIGTPSESVRTVVQGITLKNLYLIDNNQQEGTIESDNSVLFWGIVGLNIGNNGGGVNIFKGLNIENIIITDDNPVPTQQYPIMLWNYGAEGTTFTDVQISDYTFSGNINNKIYQSTNRDNVNIKFLTVPYE